MIIKKLYLYAGIILLLIIAGTGTYFLFFNEKPVPVPPEEEKIDGFVDNDGRLHYPLDRDAVEFRRMNYSEDNSTIVSKIIYKSRRGNIFGLLVMPKKVKADVLPGMVLLPGAGVSKESELPFAKEIAVKGMAVLTIDYRGVGETGGEVPSLEQDFQIFMSQREPFSHLAIYDALRAYDLLKNAPFVDSGNILMAGESIGGRIAIIASVADPNIKGTLAISTAGYNLTFEDEATDIFIKSINPDHYAQYLNKLAVIHNVNDRNIRYELGQRTFSFAKEPKKFYTLNSTTCNHGYCNEMKDLVFEAVDWLLE